MAQHIFVTYTGQTKPNAFAIGEDIFANAIVEVSNMLTPSDLQRLATQSRTEFFYVVRADTILDLSDFNFSFKPDECDRHYLHVWGNDFRIQLYCTELVLLDPDSYVLSPPLKVKSNTSFKADPFDIVLLSYNELHADKNFNLLSQKFPRVKRINGVRGIPDAHKEAAKVATTSMVFIVDADAEVCSDYDFSYCPEYWDMSTAHVWQSKNPINDLVYGYGGVKLFPTSDLINYTGSPVDFTTSVSKYFKVIPIVSNITKFNTDPFSAWRSGFRECAKLASSVINGESGDTAYRLNTWCTKGEDREFGEFAIAGAKAGRKFGLMHKGRPDKLGLINDYSWLKEQFPD